MMKIGFCRLIGAIALVAPQMQGYAASAQIENAGATAPAIAEAASSPPTEAPTAQTSITAGTIILISVDEAISSKTHKNDDWFDISLAGPVAANGAEILPKGLKGKGQVVHAAKSGWGGKAGELILAARYLEWNDKQIPLRGMKLGGTGEDRTSTATIVAATTAFPVAFAISGSSAVVEKGTMAVAKLAQDIPLIPQPAVAPAEPTQNPTLPIQGESK